MVPPPRAETPSHTKLLHRKKIDSSAFSPSAVAFGSAVCAPTRPAATLGPPSTKETCRLCSLGRAAGEFALQARRLPDFAQHPRRRLPPQKPRRILNFIPSLIEGHPMRLFT